MVLGSVGSADSAQRAWFTVGSNRRVLLRGALPTTLCPCTPDMLASADSVVYISAHTFIVLLEARGSSTWLSRPFVLSRKSLKLTATRSRVGPTFVGSNFVT